MIIFNFNVLFQCGNIKFRKKSDKFLKKYFDFTYYLHTGLRYGLQSFKILLNLQDQQFFLNLFCLFREIIKYKIIELFLNQNFLRR